MGWSYGHTTKKALIADITKPYRGRVCLAHCYRGNNFKGIVWSVWETEGLLEVNPRTSRYIVCDLLECVQQEWGHKTLFESCGPYYYSCPLSYLALVSQDRYEVNEEWRNSVYSRHANQQQRSRRKREAKNARTTRY